MKIKSILLLFLVTTFAVSSCQKDPVSPSATTYPVQGLWIGTYTVDNNPSQPSSYFYSFAVYPDGTILIKGVGADGITYYSTGSWKLSSTNEFSSTFTTLNFDGPQVTQTITVDFSDTGKMTNGVWTDIKNGTQTGKFSVNRIN